MRKFVCFSLWTAVLAVVSVLSSCNEHGADAPKMPSFTLSFSEEEITLEEGKSKNLSNLLVIEPESVGDTLTVEYSVADKKVAEVSGSGRVKALFEGRTVVTASAHGKTAEINVRVKPVPITDFNVPTAMYFVDVNVPTPLEFSVTPENASPGHLQVSVLSDNARVYFEDNVWKFLSDVPDSYIVVAQYGETKKSFALQARVVAVESVSLSKTYALVEIGAELTLTADVLPENASYPALTWTSSDPTVVTVSDGVCRALKKGRVKITAATSNGRTGTCTLQVTDEDLSKCHPFTVAKNRQVLFSPGNLQYTTMGAHNVAGGALVSGKFRFAPKQYMMAGEGNADIGSDYTGWIDLFGSGTTGYNNVNPYMSATVDNSYQSIESTNGDWGVYLYIENGTVVDPAGTWRTPTEEEWQYLLESRPGATSLYGVAQVNGVCGLVLLPDDWTAPSGVSFKSGVGPAVNQQTAAAYAAVNNLSVSQWETLEARGAVFLPAGGSRNARALSNEFEGFYWSSTRWSGYSANLTLHIYSDLVTTASTNYYHEGCSVRLVRDF